MDGAQNARPSAGHAAARSAREQGPTGSRGGGIRGTRARGYGARAAGRARAAASGVWVVERIQPIRARARAPVSPPGTRASGHGASSDATVAHKRLLVGVPCNDQNDPRAVPPKEFNC